MKKNVYLRDVETDLWNWFVGYCKQNGKKVGETLEEIIKKIQRGKRK